VSHKGPFVQRRFVHFDGKRAMRGSAFAGTTTDNGSQQVEELQAPIGAFPIQSWTLLFVRVSAGQSGPAKSTRLPPCPQTTIQVPKWRYSALFSESRACLSGSTDGWKRRAAILPAAETHPRPFVRR
jgi:hypothetical protein